jgi:glycine/D-amino acid oxidase-like deaminating enzyme
MSEKTLEDVYREGLHAFGSLDWQCPYEEGTEAYIKWREGFSTAEERFDRRVEERKELEQIEWEDSPEGKLHAKMDEVLTELKAIHALLRIKGTQ